MVYKKYIKKGGKMYGPYYYHSRREGGKVISEYHGVKKKTSHKKFLWIFLGIVVIVSAIYGLSIFEKGDITGQAVLNLEADYQEGQVLSGNLRLSLRQGELIPSSSKLVFESGAEKYEYNLNEILSKQATEGDFYIGGSSVSGTGLGYGTQGTKQVYPDVYFKINIFSSSEPSAESEPPPESPPESAQETTNETEPATEPITQEEQTQETTEETATETTEEPAPEESPPEPEPAPEPAPEPEPAAQPPPETSPITGNIIASIFGRLSPTGQVALEISNEIDEKISAGNDFIYGLEQGQTAEIVAGSVRTDSGQLSDNAIELVMLEDKVIVTTDYSETETGFGGDYLGDAEEEFVIDLFGLNMILDAGELRVSLVYEEKNIISLTASLEQGAVSAEESTPEKAEQVEQSITQANITKTNKTTTEEVALDEFEEVLTGEERAVLQDEFGNFSIEVTKAELGKRLVIRYELEDYWFEASYDVNLSDDDLNAQMQADKIKWLKDIASNFLEQEPLTEQLEEFLGNQSI